MSNKIKCPKCGHMNHPSESHCSNCGYQLKSTKEASTTGFLQSMYKTAMACPTAAGDVDLNTKNRDKTIRKHNYGPLNLNDQGYWELIADKWNTTPEVAKKSKCGNCVAFDVSPRMDECMPGPVSDGEGRLGYCWMHHFKCHSARTCNTWAKGGPIKKDEASHDWQKKSKGMGKEAELSTAQERAISGGLGGLTMLPLIPAASTGILASRRGDDDAARAALLSGLGSTAGVVGGVLASSMAHKRPGGVAKAVYNYAPFVGSGIGGAAGGYLSGMGKEASEGSSVKSDILKAFKAEGGALGMKALKKHVKAPDVQARLKDLMEEGKVYKHRHGDFIEKDASYIPDDPESAKFLPRKSELAAAGITLSDWHKLKKKHGVNARHLTNEMQQASGAPEVGKGYAALDAYVGEGVKYLRDHEKQYGYSTGTFSKTAFLSQGFMKSMLGDVKSTQTAKTEPLPSNMAYNKELNMYVDPSKPNDGVWMFHGTSPEAARLIQKEGLNPKEALKHNLSRGHIDINDPESIRKAKEQERTAKQKASVHITPHLRYANNFGQFARDGSKIPKNAHSHVVATYLSNKDLKKKVSPYSQEMSGAQGYYIYGDAYLHKGSVDKKNIKILKLGKDFEDKELAADLRVLGPAINKRSSEINARDLSNAAPHIHKMISKVGRNNLAAKLGVKDSVFTKTAAATATKTNPALWERSKQQAKARMGGKHSARAMQLATKIYKSKGGGYSGSKPTSKTNSLKKWSKQDWGYSGKDKPGQGGSGVYLPKKRRDALKSTKQGRKMLASATRKKHKATAQGKQYSSHGLAAGTSLKKEAFDPRLTSFLLKKKDKATSKTGKRLLGSLASGANALHDGLVDMYGSRSTRLGRMLGGVNDSAQGFIDGTDPAMMVTSGKGRFLLDSGLGEGIQSAGEAVSSGGKALAESSNTLAGNITGRALQGAGNLTRGAGWLTANAPSQVPGILPF